MVLTTTRQDAARVLASRHMHAFDVVILGGAPGQQRRLSGERSAQPDDLWPSLAMAVSGVLACSYVACIPSKAMLHSAQLRSLLHVGAASGQAADSVSAENNDAAYPRAAARRDELAHLIVG